MFLCIYAAWVLSPVHGIGQSSVADQSASLIASGDFVRPSNQPIIQPKPVSIFNCPMRHKQIHWESTHTFNPAAVVKDGKVWLLYRAEDDQGSGIGGFTSRLGLASSTDGIHFTRYPKPVLFPGNDSQKKNEWFGGCEDPRCVETEDGKFLVFYTEYSRDAGPTDTKLGMAISQDLLHWDKLGPVVAHQQDGTTIIPPKSASLLTSIKDGHLVATKILGKYWLYYGAGVIRLLSSPDLKHWDPVPGFTIEPRNGRFDSALAECGPPAVLTPYGIVLLYNGMNAEGENRDPAIPPRSYVAGELIMDPTDPSKVISRSTQPFFKPELGWEKTGQYRSGTTFIEGLVPFHQKWFLYYGSADQFVGVATADRLGPLGAQ
jgi:predicted GH43/DUF377 family glycosyl hydrolase